MDTPDDHLPLTPLSFHVLLALAERPLHGYGIIKRMQSREDRAIDPRTGSFYAALRRLSEDGLVEEVEPPDDRETSDGRRRYYALTGLGSRVLAAEAARLEGLAREARGALTPGRP